MMMFHLILFFALTTSPSLVAHDTELETRISQTFDEYLQPIIDMLEQSASEEFLAIAKDIATSREQEFKNISAFPKHYESQYFTSQSPSGSRLHQFNPWGQDFFFTPSRQPQGYAQKFYHQQGAPQTFFMQQPYRGAIQPPYQRTGQSFPGNMPTRRPAFNAHNQSDKPIKDKSKKKSPVRYIKHETSETKDTSSIQNAFLKTYETLSGTLFEIFPSNQQTPSVMTFQQAQKLHQHLEAYIAAYNKVKPIDELMNNETIKTSRSRIMSKLARSQSKIITWISTVNAHQPHKDLQKKLATMFYNHKDDLIADSAVMITEYKKFISSQKDHLKNILPEELKSQVFPQEQPPQQQQQIDTPEEQAPQRRSEERVEQPQPNEGRTDEE